MKFALTILALSLPILAQDGPNVNPTEGPVLTAYEKVLNYTSSNLTSVCWARAISQNRLNTSVSISAATNANPVVFTSTAHGFATSARPSVTISGGTGNWTAINGTFTATVVDANTFSIPVDSTSFGALAGTIIFKTTAPRSGVAEWAVQKLAYDGSNNLIWTGWINGVSSLTNKCSDASSTTVVQQ